MKFKTPNLSIFIKLILVVFIFGILLNICVLFVFQATSDKKPRKFLKDFSRRMERHLVYEIGIPPDTVKAKQICEDLDIEMRYEGTPYNWSSNGEIPDLRSILNDPGDRVRFEENESIIAHHEGEPYSVIRFPQGVFVIKPFNPQLFNPERAILMLILFISVVIVILYFLLRNLFSPLKDLSAAVVSIGEGNYDVKLPKGRKDELGELADSIGVMSDKINSSIKSKEQLLIDVSHELRSPLTRIKLGLEVGSSKEKLEEDVIEMEKMITDLLENYRADTGFNSVKPQKADVAELLDETIAEYDDQSRLKFSKPAKEVLCNIDMDKMQVVFRNLIDNALKYSANEIIMSITEHKGEVIISFKDNGSGISNEDLKNVFEPFYRADRSRSRRTGGFGLGLSICKKIIDAHKGELLIKSKLGSGTEAIIKLKAL
ncbi:MAG TPA: HAMP domain-containing sensor histidine kinase [Ignavibacteria bacterium]|nr:HAMP domain-containing sensor histidine kinase [Ignavibacteria bacterium]HRF67260.1 HAMP domain-containing sensor histidine kinase [Ignavibacteria bacterium]HRJ05799.1 HAMP domain-containing sensor histidine kinase [Ignavibacteria bacterium]